MKRVSGWSSCFAAALGLGFSMHAAACCFEPSEVLVDDIFAHLPRFSNAVKQLQMTAAEAQTPEGKRKQLVMKTVHDAHDLLNANKAAQALEELRPLDAVAGKTDEETFVIERTRVAIAAATSDEALLSKSAEAVVATNMAPAEEQRKFAEVVARSYYSQKNYPQAIAWINRYFKEGGTDAGWRTPLLLSYYFNNDFARAAQEAGADIRADEAAGKIPAEDELKLLMASTAQLKDEALRLAAVEKYVSYYPNKQYWAELIDKVLAKPGFSENLTLDVYRLMFATGQLFTPAEYIGMARLAMRATSAVEAKRIVDHGFASGILGTGVDAAAHRQLRDQAEKMAAGEVKSMDKGTAAALRAQDASGLVVLGNAYVNHGMVEKGIGLMEKGVRIGGLRQPDEAKLHLALAYAQTARKANAIQTFKTVQGSDGSADLARYWVMHLNSARL